MPFILGIAIVGGAIVLITSAFSGDDENDNNKNEENPQVFNADEVRRLRRQLKKQMRLKKKAASDE